MGNQLWPEFQNDYRAVFRYACRMTGSRETAEDIVQETFYRLFREFDGKLANEAARRWAFVVVRNLCLMELRRAGRSPIAHGSNAENAVSNGTPASVLADQDTGEAVARAVAALPPEQRECFILREYEDLRYEDMAAIIGCPVGTVRSRLARARETLRQKLQHLKDMQR